MGEDMFRYFTHITAAICAAVIVLGLALSCTDDDNPVKPPPPKDHYVYFADQEAPNTYFRYNTNTFDVDSFYLPYDSYYDGFCVSPDGKTMYLHPDDGIVEVSLDSFVVVAEHPITLPKGYIPGNGHQIVISPDGCYLAILNKYLYLINLADFSVIYSDTSTAFLNGWFTDDSRIFFCSMEGQNGFEALEIMLNDSIEVRRPVFSGGSVSHIMTSPDNRLRFLMLYAGYGISRFQVYDVEKDSIIFDNGRCPGAGNMAITPDGRYVIYSRPGTMLGWCPPYPYLTVFDVVGNKIDREIFTFNDSIGAALAIDELWISPDGRHLFGISAPVNNEGHGFQYNLISHEVQNRFKMYPTRFRHLMNLQGQRKY